MPLLLLLLLLLLLRRRRRRRAAPLPLAPARRDRRRRRGDLRPRRGRRRRAPRRQLKQRRQRIQAREQHAPRARAQARGVERGERHEPRVAVRRDEREPVAAAHAVARVVDAEARRGQRGGQRVVGREDRPRAAAVACGAGGRKGGGWRPRPRRRAPPQGRPARQQAAAPRARARTVEAYALARGVAQLEQFVLICGGRAGGVGRPPLQRRTRCSGRPRAWREQTLATRGHGTRARTDGQRALQRVAAQRDVRVRLVVGARVARHGGRPAAPRRGAPAPPKGASCALACAPPPAARRRGCRRSARPRGLGIGPGRPPGAVNSSPPRPRRSRSGAPRRYGRAGEPIVNGR